MILYRISMNLDFTTAFKGSASYNKVLLTNHIVSLEARGTETDRASGTMPSFIAIPVFVPPHMLACVPGTPASR
jgi:hypothetical protein